MATTAEEKRSLERATRKSVLRAARKQRPRITKVVNARALDKFLDSRPDASASLQAETTFDVGTLARGRDGYYPDPGAVTFLEPPGQGGIIGSGSPGCRAKDGADTLIATRHAELFAEVDRLLQRPPDADHELAVETDGDFHPYRGVSQPRTTHMARPVSMNVALGDRLITPHERRRVHEFEKKTKMAQQIFRKAQGDRARALEVLRTRYPNGVLGVDSPNNLESSIYGQRAEQLERVRAQTAEAQKRRAEKLAYLSDCRVRRGFDLLTLEDVGAATSANQGQDNSVDHGVMPMFQSRRRVETAPGRHDDTHQRLFAREFIKPKGVRRNKALMRNFDIVTGAAVPEAHRRPSDARVLALDLI